MRSDFKAFIGLDVHKDSIAIAYADADFTQAPRFLGTTGYSVISLTKALAKLGKPGELSVCHEAGPWIRTGKIFTGTWICHRGDCPVADFTAALGDVEREAPSIRSDARACVVAANSSRT